MSTAEDGLLLVSFPLFFSPCVALAFTDIVSTYSDVTLDEVVYADLATVLASGSSPFGPCADYIDQMYAVGSEMGIPPISASFLHFLPWSNQPDGLPIFFLQ